jgi:murein peptide amidase A
MRRLGALLTLVLFATMAVVAQPPSSYAAGRAHPHRPAVMRHLVIGHTVKGRPINAFRLGDRGRRVPKVVVMSSIHGNERNIAQIAYGLRDGAPIHGVNMWVIPIANPDGWVLDTRKNARGVDLNRNFPTGWVHTTGHYASGPRPASEPETRALMRFFKRVNPSRVISFHQPLHAVDVADKSPRFSHRLARALRLPASTVTCGGVCGGTMTQWFNAHFKGTAITVEYGAAPSHRRMAVAAPRELLRFFGAHR